MSNKKMIKSNKFAKYLIVGVGLVLVFLLSFFHFVTNTADTWAYAVTYSSVMDDLRRDSSFNASDYPDKADDYSLQVISVAESVDKELFVYVYQPSHKSKDLTATSINISLAIDDDFAPNNYKLGLVSTQGVFDKYIVKDLKIRSDETRYYNIPSIFRALDKSIDGEPGNNNTVSEVSYSVGWLYTAKTINGAVNYGCSKTETIEITDKYCGSICYLNGFKLYIDKCHSWYVAFDTDKPIDKLMEADVYYVSQAYTYEIWGLIPSKKYGDPEDGIAKLKYTDVASNSANGLFAKRYTWNRIESVSDFLAGEDLTSEAISALNGKKWVLRFIETPYSYVSSANHSVENSIIVSDVSILRLKFETDGVTYNLGVVDNKQTADPSRPDNNNTTEFDFSHLFNPKGERPWYYYLILAIVGLLLLALLIPIIPYVVKIIIWIISLPFKLIKAIFKGISGSKRKNE